MFVHIAYENYIQGDDIVAVLKPDSAPVKRLKQRAFEAERLIDATAGHKTRSIIVMKTNYIILCGLTTARVIERADSSSAPFTKEQT
jgi:hypothetical protein